LIGVQEVKGGPGIVVGIPPADQLVDAMILLKEKLFLIKDTEDERNARVVASSSATEPRPRRGATP
jgi:hypothetical protein